MQFYEEDQLMRGAAGRFLDRFCRQNTAEVPHIALKQEIVLVRHAPAEQALYLGEAHDAPDVNWEDHSMSDGKAKLLEHLLKLCSHYQAGGGSSVGLPEAGAPVGAQAECERVAANKARKAAQERRTLARCARVVQLLAEKVREDESASWRADLDATVESLRSQGRLGVAEFEQEAQAAVDEGLAQRCAVLAGHRPRDEALNAALAKCVDGESGIGSLRHWQAFSSEMLSAKQAKDLLAGQVSEQIENLMTFSAALASQQYFTAVRRALVDEWPQARGCAVCGEEDLPSRSLIVTPCGHCFCARCLAAPGPLRQSCKACGQPLKEGDLEPLARSLTQAKEQFQGSGAAGDEVEVSEGSAAERSDGGRFLKRFGTKLAVLVERLQGLRTADPTAKCILFVQFDDLKMQVGAALREGGIPTAQLKGSVSQRAAIIRDYQENPESKIFVLLLSLAESASGTNLTAGSHVIFLHPMLAARPERAAAQELQAIGRARRHGQKRETLHVWRFVTGGTLEEAFTARHLSRLLEYEAESRVRAETLKKDAAERAEREKKPAPKKQRRY